LIDSVRITALGQSAAEPRWSKHGAQEPRDRDSQSAVGTALAKLFSYTALVQCNRLLVKNVVTRNMASLWLPE